MEISWAIRLLVAFLFCIVTFVQNVHTHTDSNEMKITTRTRIELCKSVIAFGFYSLFFPHSNDIFACLRVIK